MSKFGQRVRIIITNKNKDVVLDSESLRIDFDIRNIPGYSRGTFKIYNLSDATTGNVLNGDNQVTLEVQLHEGTTYTLVKDWPVNNAINELILPNNIVTLYAFNGIKSKVLEKQINIEVTGPSLKKNLEAILSAAKHKGGISFISFPDGVLEQTSSRGVAHFPSSAMASIRKLQRQYPFEMYTNDEGIVFLYKPNIGQLGWTKLPDKKEEIVLETVNMVSNPVLGVSVINITSNLDGRIVPSSLLNTANLITAGVGSAEETLQTVKGFIKGSIAGWTKYQTLAVQHKGSNYTKNWTTIATGIAPTSGRNMPLVNWFR